MTHVDELWEALIAGSTSDGNIDDVPEIDLVGGGVGVLMSSDGGDSRAQEMMFYFIITLIFFQYEVQLN